MINAILTAIGLGIAGIDPLGALLLMSAITAGMSSLKIKLFTITVFVSTILTGDSSADGRLKSYGIH
jgi:hypothetical protein